MIKGLLTHFSIPTTECVPQAHGDFLKDCKINRFTAVCLVVLFALLAGIPTLSALNPADVSIENKSGPYFILDEDDPCFGPRAGFIAYQICNTKGQTLEGVNVGLSGLDNGFSLSGGQVAQQSLGSIEVDACRMAFWYVAYPCDDDLSTDVTITISDNLVGTVNTTNSLGLIEAEEKGSNARINWMDIGSSFTAQGEIYVDVEYAFKNTRQNRLVYFQPTVDTDFDAACLQLTRFTVLESGIPGVLEGEGEALYNILPERIYGTEIIYARFFFKVNCSSFETEITPFATANNGNNGGLRYRNDEVIEELNIPGDLPLPCNLLSGDEFLARSFDVGGNNWSTSWADYNRDGYPDVFITTNSIDQPNQLYRNNGDGSFTQVASGAIASDKAPSTASTWGDYDNDGDPDLFVSNNIGYPNFLYRNEGNGNFTRIQGDPIVEHLGYSHGASWADFDNDGFLDLFVATYWETEFNLMYRNNGDGTFSMVTNNQVVNEASRSVSGTWADYDGDGWQDLFVANLEGRPNSLYRNLGGGDFEKITSGLIVTDPGWSVGGSWADYDNDGDFDLFVANASEEANFLYQNNGNGTFTKVTAGEIVTNTGHTHGSAWADYDNDGDLDLFVTNDGADNQMYANNGDGTFTRIENELTDDGGLSFGTAWADIDSDGDLDLIVANRNNQANFLYENNRWNCNNYACVNLVGTNSNKSAIGAKVTVVAEIYGEMVSQTRLISAQTGGGIGGQNGITAHFGLGNADFIESITVLWPSGYQQTLTDEPVNDCYTIEEENAAEITGMVYFEEENPCENTAGGLPPGAEAAEFRTAQGGDWDSNSTWGGNPPPANISGRTISIEHDVIRDGNLKIQNNGQLWVTNGSLIMEDGNLTVNNGDIYLQGAEFEVEDGNFTMSSDQSFIDAKNSVISVDGNMTNYGTSQIVGVCFEVGGNFSSTTGTSEFVNSIIHTDGNFQTSLADLHFENTQIWVEDGNFQLSSFTLTTGSNVVVWVEDGNWQNSNSTWSASVTQYCVDGNISGLGGALPAESCGGISSNFSNGACESKLTESSPTVINEEDRIPIHNAQVVLQPGNIMVYTDENGYYSALVPAGETYDVEIHPGDNWKTMCPNEEGMLEVAVQEIGARYENNNFGHEALCTLPDMEVEIALTSHRIGFENLMVINYENIGAFTGTDIQLLVSLDESITPVSANVPWEGLASTILIWNFDQLEPAENGAIYLTYTVDENTTPGEPIEVNANLDCVENDCNPINDTFLSAGFAEGALDPNDILVNPEGGIQADKELTYKIRFQNVGNTPASHVRIENELPEELDLSTLKIGLASHPYQFRAEGHKLVWDFPAINLPDSLNNEPESHGFVTYRIKPKAELRPGDKFDNGAAIYFDNLAPIITNRVENFILAELIPGTKPNVLYAYPNPTNGTVTAQFQQLNLYEEGAHLQTIEVYDQIGRLVLRQHQYRGYHMQLDLGNQTPGLYTLHGIDDQGRRFIGKVIVAE